MFRAHQFLQKPVCCVLLLVPTFLSFSSPLKGVCFPKEDEPCGVCTPPLPKYCNLPFITADFIYWVPKQGGNQYAATGTTLTVPNTTDPNTSLTASAIPQRGRVYEPCPAGKPGFKVGVGMNLTYDSWDLFTEYTYLSGSETSSVYSSNTNSGVLPLVSYTPNNSVLMLCNYAVTSGATGYVSGATAYWSLFFNNLNLELGKWIPLMCNVVLHPHFGLEGSWQTQRTHYNYFVNSLTTPSESLGFNNPNIEQYFWGIGPRVGVDSLWQCYKHLGLFADMAFAALWGRFRTISTDYDTNTSAGYSNVQLANQIYHPKTISPLLQLALGAQSDWTFCNTYRLTLNIAWETQVWFSQNQHSTSVADIDLFLQGLTCGARFDF